MVNGCGWHAGSISGGLDLVEKRLKRKSEEFTKHFEQFYLKAVEMTGYLRTELHHFPALKKFTKDVSLELKLFSHFLHEVEELELSNEILSALSARMADHMAREECYYLLKLAQSFDLRCQNVIRFKEKRGQFYLASFLLFSFLFIFACSILACNVSIILMMFGVGEIVSVFPVVQFCFRLVR